MRLIALFATTVFFLVSAAVAEDVPAPKPSGKVELKTQK